DKQPELSIRQPQLGPNRLIDRLLAMPEVKKAYLGQVEKVAATAFRAEKLLADIEAMERATREAVVLENKGHPKGPVAGGWPMGLMKVPELKPFITMRAESVALQLAGKSEGYKPTFGFGFGPPPGGPKGGPGFGPGQFLAPEVLKAADTNKDKKVSLEEWVEAAKRLFKECDTEGAGVITEKQLAEGIARL